MTASTSPVARARNVDLALAILRIVVGIVFIAHGAQKLFTFGIPGTIAAFGGMGVPIPSVSAVVVIVVELLGGILLVLGLFTRIAAVLIAVDMLGAILLVHLKGGFFLPNGVEFALTLFAAMAALAIGGPGAFAIDDLMDRRRRVG